MITESDTWAANVQFDPLIEAGYEGADVLEVAIAAPNLRPTASRQVGLRIAMPGSEAGVLGALGAEFLPDQSGQLLVLVVISDRGSHTWHADGLCALPEPFGQYVLDGVLGAPDLEAVGSGVLRFDRALLTPGSSNADMFAWLGAAVAQVIAAGEAIPGGAALRSLLGALPDTFPSVDIPVPPAKAPTFGELLPASIRPASLRRWRPPRANRPRLWIGTHSVPRAVAYSDEDLPAWLTHARNVDRSAELPADRPPRADGWVEPEADLSWLPADLSRAWSDPALLPAARPAGPGEASERWAAAPQWQAEDPEWLSEAVAFDTPEDADDLLSFDVLDVPAREVLPALGAPIELPPAPPAPPVTFMSDEDLDDFLQAPLDFALGSRDRTGGRWMLPRPAEEDSRYSYPPPAHDAEDDDPREATYLCASCGRYAAEWLKPGLYRCTHCGATVEYDFDTAAPPRRPPHLQ